MRIVALTLLAAALASCATAPAPPETGRYGGLRVCPGNVSNAPAADRDGLIRGFEPVVRIAGASLLRAPVAACVSSGFGPRRGGAGSFHEGVDLYTRTPSAIVAGGDGVVEHIGSQRGYGRTIVIRHNSALQTRYGHLSSYARNLRKGDRVKRNDPIGRTGDSGNATAVHLHYEILIRGRPVDPLTAGK